MAKQRKFSVKKQQLRALAKDKIIAYLSDPDNEWINRTEYSTQILDYSHGPRVYDLFSPKEMGEIEREALDVRRQHYAGAIAKADCGLLKRASEGDPQACKLVFQRYEGWEPSERKKIDVSGEIRAQVFREILDQIDQVGQGFADVFPEDGEADAGSDPGTDTTGAT